MVHVRRKVLDAGTDQGMDFLCQAPLPIWDCTVLCMHALIEWACCNQDELAVFDSVLERICLIGRYNDVI